MTLLSANEDLEPITAELRAQLDDVVAAIRAGARVYLHCAAGLHRTGMIAAAILLLGEGPEIDLVARIHELRPETAAELRADRVAWARRIAGCDHEAAKPATILGILA